MLMNILKGILALVVVGIGTIFYQEAQGCRAADEYRVSLEAQRAKSPYTEIQTAKNLCQKQVDLELNNRRIGFSKIETYHQGSTQLYHDVRVGVYGTSGGQIKFPVLSLSCLTNLASTEVIRIDSSKETFATGTGMDKDANLEFEIWRARLDATACSSNPFYK